MPHYNADFTGIAREFPEGYHRNFSIHNPARAVPGAAAISPGRNAGACQRLVAERPQSYLARHWQEIYRLA